MSDKYVALYEYIDHAEEEASVLAEEGIDVTVKLSSALDEPEGSNLPEVTPLVAPASLVFPTEEDARRAADFIKVADITRPVDEMDLEGERRFRR